MLMNPKESTIVYSMMFYLVGICLLNLYIYIDLVETLFPSAIFRRLTLRHAPGLGLGCSMSSDRLFQGN